VRAHVTHHHTPVTCHSASHTSHTSRRIQLSHDAPLHANRYTPPPPLPPHLHCNHVQTRNTALHVRTLQPFVNPLSAAKACSSRCVGGCSATTATTTPGVAALMLPAITCMCSVSHVTTCTRSHVTTCMCSASHVMQVWGRCGFCKHDEAQVRCVTCASCCVTCDSSFDRACDTRHVQGRCACARAAG